MANGKVTKIYELKVIGFENVKKDFNATEAAIQKVSAAKRELNKLMNEIRKTQGEESQAYKDAAKALEQQKIATLNLKAERQKLINEEKALQLVRQAEINQQKQKVSTDNAEAGSIALVRKEIKELNAALILKNQKGTSTIDFRGEILSIDQAVKKMQQLTAAEQDYRRQFAADKTLVGEYTSGIVQAFQKMGLSDLVAGQVTKAKAKLKDLDKEAEKIKQDLTSSKGSGNGMFEKLEAQLISNRKEAAALKQQISAIAPELKGVGNIGSQITNSINHGFKEMTGHAASFILTFVGVQSAFTFFEDSLEKFEKAEMGMQRLENAVKNLGGNEQDLHQLGDTVTELTKKFGYLSKLELRDAEEKLVKFGKLSTSQIKSFLPVIVDLAANQRQGVTETTDTLLAAIEGNARALKKFGINIKDVKSESERFALIQEEVSKRVKGSAEIFQNSAAGSAETYKRKLAGLKVEIGEQLMPVYEAFLNLSIKGISILKQLNFGTLIKSIAAFAGVWIAYRIAVLASNVASSIRLSYLVAEQVATKGASVATAINTVVSQTNTIAEIESGKVKKGNIIITYLMVGAQKAYAVATEAAAIATRFFGNVVRVTPLGVILTGLLVVIAAFKSFAALTKQGASNLIGLNSEGIKAARIAKELKGVMVEANKEFVSQRETIEKLVKTINDENVKLVEKKKALGELIALDPEFLKGLKLSKDGHLEGAQAIDTYIEALKRKAIAEASHNKIVQLEGEILDIKVQSANSQDILDAARQSRFNKFDANRTKNKQNRKIKTVEVSGPTSEDTQSYIDEEQAKKNVEKFNNQIGVIEERIRTLTEIEKRQGNVLAKFKQSPGLTNNLKGPESDLSKAVKDRLSIIDAAMKTELALEERRIIDIKNKRKLTYEEEIQYVQNVQRINNKYLNQKINYLTGLGKLDATQIEQKAQFGLEMSKVDEKAIDDINNIREKEFNKRYESQKLQLERELQLIKEQDQQVQENINSTETDKAQSRLDADRKAFQLREDFGAKIEKLEAQLNYHSLKALEDNGQAKHDLQVGMNEDSRRLLLSSLTTTDQILDQEIARIKLKYGDLRNTILSSNKSQNDKSGAIGTLNKFQNIELATAQLAAANKNVKTANGLYKEGLITLADYEKYYQKATEGQEALNNAINEGKKHITGFGDLINGKLSKLFGFSESSDKGKLLADTISKTYSFATDAMNNYFDQERQHIQDSLALTEERLGIEKQQQLKRAQSKAEEESIERQFAARKKVADKKAFEDNKKLQKSQAQINLAMQLSNLAVIAFAPNPLNIATLGTAGAIMYAVQAALALASYAINVSRINSAKFEYGGVPGKGGRFGGRSHANGGTPFTHKGQQFEAEVDELAVIRTKNAPRDRIFSVVGTQMQIASKMNAVGGGHDFQPGAAIKQFAGGGHIGTSLRAPMFIPSGSNSTYINSGISEEKFGIMMNEIRGLAQEQSNRIDRLEVVQTTSSVTRAQKKEVQQQNIGTL